MGFPVRASSSFTKKLLGIKHLPKGFMLWKKSPILALSQIHVEKKKVPFEDEEIYKTVASAAVRLWQRAMTFDIQQIFPTIKENSSL